MHRVPPRFAVWMLVITLIQACGSARTDSNPSSDPNWLDVNSKALFGNQCPDGSWVDPVPAAMSAVDCGLPLAKVELVQPVEPLMLSADCTKKVITVRSPHPGGLDATWEVLPDNTFEFNVDGGKLALVDDGRGHKNCTLPAVINVWGKLNCQNRDKITMDFQANWTAGQLNKADYTITPFSKLHPDPGEVFCQVAPTCYLNAGTKMNQCM